MSYLRTLHSLIGASLVVTAALTSIAVPSTDVGHDAHRYATLRLRAPQPKSIEPSAVADQTELTGPSQVTVSGGTFDQREVAAWALQRFEDAGLEVPLVAIHLHQEVAECKGNRGIYNSGSQRIDVCVNERNVVLHEIAHAWNHENLSEAQRSEYVLVGGFGSWDDPDTPWFDRGSEDAADTIAWALLDESITMYSPDGPIARRGAAYLLLTGSHASRMAAQSTG